MESARLLDASEYTVNTKLGYISLKTQLQADEVLAVAYNYTYSDGKTYQVGEFSTDNPSSAASCLYVKLLKGITMSPDMPLGPDDENIYSLGAYSVQREVQVEYHVSKRYNRYVCQLFAGRGDCQPNLVTSAEPG